MSGFSLQVGRSSNDLPPVSFGAFAVTTTATSAEFSQIQLAAGSRGLWLIEFGLVSPDNLSIGVFASDQMDGAVDTPVAVQTFDLSVQATAKFGTSTAGIHPALAYRLLVGSIANPFYCPPNKFLLIGDRTANTTFSVAVRFLEYL